MGKLHQRSCSFSPIASPSSPPLPPSKMHEEVSPIPSYPAPFTIFYVLLKIKKNIEQKRETSIKDNATESISISCFAKEKQRSKC